MSAIVKYEGGRAIAPRTISHGYSKVAADITKYFDQDIARIPHMSPEEYGLFRDYGNQMKWLKEHLSEIKEIWKDIVDGQVGWNEAQAEMVKRGLKGGEKIEKAVVDISIAAYKLEQQKLKQQHRLTNAQEIENAQTEKYKSLKDAKKNAALEIALERLNKGIEEINNRPEMAALVAEWEETNNAEFEKASIFLGVGSNAPTHPRFPGSTQQLGLPGGSSNPVSFSKQTAARASDSIRFAFKWSGNAAKSVKGFAGNLKRGIGRISKFFGGKG